MTSDIYPTLLELCGLPARDELEGIDLGPLLKNAQADWKHPAITTYHANNHSVRSEHFRYIRYADGGRELYDHQSDPHEWHNLAADPQHADLIRKLDRHIPKNCAPYAPKREGKNRFTQEFDWSKP